MATQKKGCGFLITALILLLLGGGIGTFLGMSAFSTGKKFADNITNGTSFATPGSSIYSSNEESEVTVWVSNAGSTDIGTAVVSVSENPSGNAVTVVKPSGSSTMGDQQLIATFKVEKGKDYQVSASGLADGCTVTVSSIPSSAVLSMVGKGFGAFASIGIGCFLALIFGIIGLIKYFGSKNAQAQAAPVAPAGSPPSM